MIGIVPLLILALASYRITRAVARDSITATLRDALTNWALTSPTSRWRAAVDVLVQCTYCIGWWISGATLATYLLATGSWHQAPLAVHAIEWAAVAGAQAYLNAGDDTATDTREALAAYTEQQHAEPPSTPPHDISVPVPGPEHHPAPTRTTGTAAADES